MRGREQDLGNEGAAGPIADPRVKAGLFPDGFLRRRPAATPLSPLRFPGEKRIFNPIRPRGGITERILHADFCYLPGVSGAGVFRA
jgi:hypothetical protein